MPIYLRQSTAGQEVPLGYFVDSTDADTAETALTIANTDIKLWKFGATALANKNSGGATHMAGGVYYCVLDATDTDTLGSMVVFVHVSGALAVRLECVVMAANVYDSLIAGSDLLEIDMQQLDGSATAANYAKNEQLQEKTAGTADSGTTTTLVDAALTQGDDYWNGAWLRMKTGANAGLARQITGFTASTDTITVAPAFPSAISTDDYVIVPAGRVDVGLWVGNAVTFGTGGPNVNVNAISDDTTAAANLEAQYDGTGLDGDTYPATQSQIGAVGSGGAGNTRTAIVSDDNASGTNPLKGVTFVGSLDAGTYANLAANDGSIIDITDTTSEIDYVQEYDLGTAKALPNTIELTVLFSGNDDTCLVQVYDNDATGWQTVATLNGTGGSAYSQTVIPINETRYIDSSGLVYVRFHSTATANQRLRIDRSVVTWINQTAGYQNGAVWIDTTDGAAGTVPFVNGTADNPVDNLADAIAIAAAVGLSHFEISPDSSITFAESHSGELWTGKGWTCGLGSQDLSQTHLYHAKITTGACTSPSGEVHIENTHVSGCSFGGDTHLTDCHLGGTITITATGDYLFENCHSDVLGAGAATIDMGAAVGATNLALRNWGGGNVSVTNIKAGDYVTIEGTGGDLTINGTGGDVKIRGTFESVTDSSGGAVTIDQGADIVTTLAAILEDTGTTLPAAITGAPAAVLAAGDIDGFSLEEAMKVILAAEAGKVSGSGTTTIVIRAADNSKDRITATVSDGNRTAVVVDASG